MNDTPAHSGRPAALLHATAWIAALACVLPASAQEAPALPELPPAPLGAPPADLLPGVPLPPAATPKETRSRKFSVNLVNRLVARGALTKEDAAELIALADADTAAAEAESAAAPRDPQPLVEDVRVPYVPETVRTQLREEVTQAVVAQGRAEGWASRGGKGSGKETLPEPRGGWEPFGDLRLRYDSISFPDGNDNTGAFPNFNAINTGSPFDVAGTEFSPQYNVDKDRRRTRLRFRLGAEIPIEEEWSAGFRIGTGQDNSPVSSNQSLGLANQGQGGNFSKYAIWLDRAFLNYHLGEVGESELTLSLGRFDNPFFSTTAIYSEDLGFDGLAIRARTEWRDGISPWVTAGAFPVFNTDLNFSSNQPAKFSSTDKWLYAAQVGVDFKLKKDVEAKLGLAYYDFQNVEGKFSSPFTPLGPNDAGDTDNTRPAFAQKGNTYMPLRNIIPGPLNNNGTTDQYQYYGLATPFRVLALTGKVDFNKLAPFQLSLTGEYLKNTAWDRDAINGKAVNNRGPNTATGATGAYEGGDTAWILNLRAGKPLFEKRGDWNASIGYRYVESDAVVDGFNDQDFGGGGTNMKGFTLGANYAISRKVRAGLRWMSAQQIAGPTLESDILFFDLSTKF